MKLKFFREPEDYNNYLFWRAQHHRYALMVIGYHLLILAISKVL